MPKCSMLSMQALFGNFFTYLVEVEHMEHDVAKMKADKIFTMLVLSNIEYEDIKQLVLNQMKNNLDQEAISGVLDEFIDSKGITRLFRKDEFLRQCVEHFHLTLKPKQEMKKGGGQTCKNNDCNSDFGKLNQERGNTNSGDKTHFKSSG